MRPKLLVAFMLLLTLATLAFPQEGSGAEPVAAARDLLAGIERDLAELEQMASQPGAAGLEEQALLELRRARASEDVLARINEFVAVVVELEQEGKGVPELHEEARKLVLKIDP